MIEEKSRRDFTAINRGRKYPEERNPAPLRAMNYNPLKPKNDRITQVANKLAPKYGNTVLNPERNLSVAAKSIANTLMKTPLRKWTPNILQEAEKLLGPEIIDKIRLYHQKEMK